MKTHNPTNQSLLFEVPYHSVAPERCALQHDWRLVCFGPDPKSGIRVYEYQCNLCNVEHIFQAERMERKPNPLCAEGKHYWIPGCYDGCCPWMFCYCGAFKPIHPEQTTEGRLRFTHDFAGNPLG